MSHRFHHGPLAPLHTGTAFDTYRNTCLCPLLLLLVLALAGCMDHGGSGWPGGICDTPACWHGAAP